MEKYNKIFTEDYKKYKGNIKFKLFNKTLFNNELPNDYKVKFELFPSFTILGEVRITSKEIAINKNKLPDEVLDLILIHEMIHISVFEKYGPVEINSPHGKEFQLERKRILSISDYDIPQKEDISSIEKILSKLGY